jgi:hypothetical protein
MLHSDIHSTVVDCPGPTEDHQLARPKGTGCYRHAARVPIHAIIGGACRGVTTLYGSYPVNGVRKYRR